MYIDVNLWLPLTFIPDPFFTQAYLETSIVVVVVTFEKKLKSSKLETSSRVQISKTRLPLPLSLLTLIILVSSSLLPLFSPPRMCSFPHRLSILFSSYPFLFYLLCSGCVSLTVFSPQLIYYYSDPVVRGI